MHTTTHAAIMIPVLLAVSAQAQSVFRWIANAPGAWDTPQNWSPPGNPSGLGVEVLFAGSGAELATLGVFPPDVATLRILNPLASVRIDDDRGMVVRESLVNEGSILISPSQPLGFAALLLGSEADVSGSGTIRLSGSSTLLGPVRADGSWTVPGNQRVVGHGTVGGIGLNRGEIRAEGGELVLRDSQLDQRGVVASSPGSVLRIEEADIVQGDGGRIDANGGVVLIGDGVTIRGGMLGPEDPAHAAGSVRITESPTLLANVQNSGTLSIDRGRTLGVAYSIWNDGRIELGASGNPSGVSFLAAAPDSAGHLADVVIDGTGEIVLNGGEAAWLLESNGSRYIQKEEHTIRGAGVVCCNITNYGTIAADVPGAPIRFSWIRNASRVQNHGRITAAAGSSIVFDSYGALCEMSESGTIDIDGGHLEIGGGNLTEPYYFHEGGTYLIREGGSININRGGFRSVVMDVRYASDATYTEISIQDSSVLGDLAGEGIYLYDRMFHIGTFTATDFMQVSGQAWIAGNGTLVLGSNQHPKPMLTNRRSGDSLTNELGHIIAGSFETTATLINKAILSPGQHPGDSGEIFGHIQLHHYGTLRLDIGETEDTTDRLGLTGEWPVEGTLQLQVDPELLDSRPWVRTPITSSVPITGGFGEIIAPPGVRVVIAGDIVRVGQSCNADRDLDLDIDTDDAMRYFGEYTQGLPEADLAAPFGTLNYFDIAEFLRLYHGGCP